MAELAALVTTPTLVPLTLGDYLRLDEAGAFEDYGKTELIEGQIYYMNAQHRPHARVKSDLFVQLALALRSLEADVRALVEASIAVPPHNAPEPDIVLTDAADGTGLVPLDSVRLVIEVSETTLSNDLGRKAKLYARHGIAEYWVVDVTARVFHQMWRPEVDAYTKDRIVPFGYDLRAETITGLLVATGDL
ncbi:Uma2 family endonuclease [Sphingomonas sp. BIUV-7]|uniref:Uma2 family endonuclease n=1 Tax=Sphingomonas natans TaxID=3063330 RepID=A0ABT8Y483_9SPHN|nr:Uma2 family endonuclease [Sphingomonas sp. BIUV-7]MDO6413118.1 Uma2 family endonuclease [Sphingomonas sp. BIUV-7]